MTGQSSIKNNFHVKNYQKIFVNNDKGILKYKIVHLIFQKIHYKKLKSKLNYPLDIFVPKTNIHKEMLNSVH